VEWREHFALQPIGTGRAAAVTTHRGSVLGAQLGLDLRKPVGERLSLGLKVAYFQPLLLSGEDAGSALAPGENSRNLSLGAQLFYFLAPGWGAGAGVYQDFRSVSFTRGGSSAGTDRVVMDGTYFFGSLLYLF
jgi:hypothetical protein